MSEHVGGLLKRDVRGDRDDHLGLPDALLDAPTLAVHEHRVDQALGATEGDDAADLLAGVVLRHRLSVEQRGGHRDDLALELGGTRIHVALQDVGVGEEPVGLGQECVVIVTAVIDRPRDLPGVADAVLLLGHGAQLGEDVLP